MTSFLLKLALMPTVIALVTLAIRRWGPQIGGLIGSLPWVAGPILFFFILEQGKAFGIQSVGGIMTGLLALISFCISYAYFSRSLRWLPTLALSYGWYALTALVGNALQLNVKLSYGLVLASIGAALWFFPASGPAPRPARQLAFDIPIRMLVATLFTIVITGGAQMLGPTWSGVLTPFPILTSILAIFTHTLQGSSATIRTLRGLVLGLFGFATFLFSQAFLLAHYSVALSFGLAFLLNVTINVGVGRLAHRRV